MSVTIKIKNQSAHPLPSYATEGASGMDVRASLPQSIELAPLQRVLVPTGLFIELPPGFEAQIRPRSGLAIKHGITCLNSPGTIDADYRGEIKIVLVNLSNEMQLINDGDRVAQMVVQKVEKVHWHSTVALEETTRNTGGFGSTGKI